MSQWVEKRQHHRLHMTLPLLYERFDRELGYCREYAATTVNISLGGLYFTCRNCDDQMELQRELDVTIQMPPKASTMSKTDSIKATGRIIRIDPVPEHPRARGVALEFLQPLPH